MSHNWKSYRPPPPQKKSANDSVITSFFTKPKCSDQVVSPLSLQQSVPVVRSETVTASPCQGDLSLAYPATVSPFQEEITLTKSAIVSPIQDGHDATEPFEFSEILIASPVHSNSENNGNNSAVSYCQVVIPTLFEKRGDIVVISAVCPGHYLLHYKH
ncbi:hypothetical protein DPMN_060794 [Dreissena polymorpha]|uniref:Uncharacterized protein n=1 Tax=Dreissena polymorpha TaxID=45954 RepID=A0A9D4C6E1_DREPO|nr:hypothetical protein DPMN_060794 [Dreissena polymorpha]